jgi:hypothetical protein
MPTTHAEPAISERLARLDWNTIHESLREHGYAVTPAVLTPSECETMVRMYVSSQHFRSHIVMGGDYKYFDYPLPAIVQELREQSYP